MKAQTKRDLLIGLAAGAAMALLVWLLEREESVLRRLCDGSFVAAVALLGSGGLSFARNQGQFDIIGYGVSAVVHTRWSFTQSPFQEKESFAEYKERKRKERKSPAGTLLSGCVWLVLSVVFLLLYLRLNP